MAAIQTASKIDNDGNDNFPAVHYAVGHYVSRGNAAAIYAIYRLRLPRYDCI